MGEVTRIGRAWALRDGPGFTRAPVNGFDFLDEAYLASDPTFQGRIVESDWRFFLPLIRVDVVAYIHFKSSVPLTR